MDILEIEGLHKTFGSLHVIDGLNMKVPEGSVFGFLGKNGAGKTTTMKLITGLIKADEGVIKIGGDTVRFGDTKTNRRLGFLPDVPEFYGFMNPKEYLRLCGRLSGMSPEEIRGKTGDLLALVGLDGIKRRIGGFSRGMKQRLGIAQALMGDPELLLCDEPTSALDPVGRKEILDVLKEIRSRTTIVFSTHILADVDRICDSIGILHKGSLAVEGTIKEIKERYANETIAVEIAEPDRLGAVRDGLLKSSAVKKADIEGSILTVSATDAHEVGRRIAPVLAEHELTLLRYESLEPDLEQVFLEVIEQ